MKAVSASIVILAFGMLAAVRVAETQSRRVDIEDRCVDRVALRGGPTLYGAILARSEDGTLVLAVRREWLQAKSKSFYAEQTEVEAEKLVAGLETLRDRIRDWRNRVSDRKNLDRYLREQLATVEQKLAEAKANPAVPNTQFTILELPEKQVRHGYSQSGQNRRVALAAWELKLEDVESRPAGDLANELTERDADWAQSDVDLSDRLPFLLDGEREWAARRAIVEHHFWKSLKFQGTGSYLVETGGEQPPLMELLPELLNRELGKQLDDLLGTPGSGPNPKPDPIAVATKTADQKQISSVVITRLDQSLAEKRISVETILLAKMTDGRWERVWRHVATADASQPRKAIEDELANHEQIQQIAGAVKALGLPGAEENLTTAIRFGATTMEAQEKSEAALDAFVERYVQSLSRPPLILSGQ